ncbi:MAG: pantoate--beta-alanine ligase [Methylotetracoccus sp.]|jgi:pantoate--beta-alanine ligase|nr:pantoate--beta-alanine ligase [Methylotetracoccus sp.]
MDTAETIAEVRAQVTDWRKTGESVGFVPTMGNLHAGHLSLVELAREQADRVVVSIFVNPLQFGPGEDFDRYPRTLEEDRRKLIDTGADLLFLPSVYEMYPADGGAATFVHVPGLSEVLCGQSRPGHFRGVATVVCKLLNIVQPTCVVLGEKDFQQLVLLQKMVRDLDLPVEIIPAPTRREANGLALSSRNGYLTAEQREDAAQLQRCLEEAGHALELRNRTVTEAETRAVDQLRQAGFRVDYVSVRRRNDLALPCDEDRELIVLAAAWMDRTRLIDNRKIDRQPPARE